MKNLPEHVSASVVVRAMPENVQALQRPFAAEVRGVARQHRGGYDPIMVYGATSDRAFARAAAVVLRELGDRAENSTDGEMPDRMIIEIRRDRSRG